MAVMYFVGYDAPWKLVVGAIGLVLLGIPQGVNNIMSYAMIGDTVDYLEWKTGERGEGICFVKSPDTLWNVLILSGVISMFACAVPMFFYSLTEKRQRELVEEIEARKAAK